jgi:hypothetical protein
MAEEFKGINQETLKNVELLKSSMKEIVESTKNLNKQFKDYSSLLQSSKSNYDAITSSASKFAELQTKVSKNASTTSKVFGEQQKQLSVVRSLNAQIENLMDRIVNSTKEEEKVLLKQAQNLAAARDNAKELANAYGELAENSADLDKSTIWFSAIAEVAKDIPGLRKISGPFEAASQAARATVISNAKNKAFLDEALKTGKDLTAEKIKELGLTKQAGGLTGSAAASRLKSAGVIAKTENASIAGMQAGFKALGPIISKAIAPLALIKGLVEGIKFFVKSMFEASTQIAEFQRDMGLTRDAAGDLRQRTFEIAKNSANLADTQGRILITQKQIVQSQKEINDALETQIDFTKELGVFGEKLLVQSSILRDNLGLSADVTGELTNEAIRTGIEVEDNTKKILGSVAAVGLEKKILLDINKILSEAAKTQGNIRLSFKGSTAELAKGVAQAKLLGLTLKQNEGIARNLLNFEESISSELEAELLTGMNLNLERARLLALNGDLVGVGKEINKQGVTYNKLQSMNLIQREAISKSLGLTTDELADSLKKQEEYNALQARSLRMGIKISNIEKKSLQEIFEEGKNIGRNQEQIVELLGEEIYKRKQAEDAQTKFNKALDSAKESFAKLVDGGAIDKFADVLTKFISTVQSKGFISALFGDYRSDQQILQEKVNAELKVGKGVVFEKTKEEIKSKGLELKNNRVVSPEQVDDFILRPGQKPIKYNKDDIIIGGTNLDGGNTSSGNNEIISLLKELISAVKSEGNVYLDGTKVGTAMAVSTYRVQ